MAKIAVRLKMKVKSGRKIKKWKLEGIKEKAVNFQTETLKELTKCNNAKNGSVEEDWKLFREAVKRSAEATIGYQTAKIAKKMIEKMEERRNYKNINTEVGKKKYRYLNNELRRETDKAREDW